MKDSIRVQYMKDGERAIIVNWPGFNSYYNGVEVIRVGQNLEYVNGKDRWTNFWNENNSVSEGIQNRDYLVKLIHS